MMIRLRFTKLNLKYDLDNVRNRQSDGLIWTTLVVIFA